MTQKAFVVEANDLLVKNNKSLKIRKQFAIEMEIERGQWNNVKDIECLHPDTRYSVAIVPFTLTDVDDGRVKPTKAQAKKTAEAGAEAATKDAEEEGTLVSTGFYPEWRKDVRDVGGQDVYEWLKTQLLVKHLSDLEKMSRNDLIKIVRLTSYAAVRQIKKDIGAGKIDITTIDK